MTQPTQQPAHTAEQKWTQRKLVVGTGGYGLGYVTIVVCNKQGDQHSGYDGMFGQVDAGNYRASITEGEANAARVVETWNACLSIPHPATAIPALRDMLESIISISQASDNPAGFTREDFLNTLLHGIRKEARVALALIQEVRE